MTPIEQLKSVQEAIASLRKIEYELISKIPSTANFSRKETLELLFYNTAESFGFTVEELKYKNKSKERVIARMVFFHIGILYRYKKTEMAALVGCNHSTITHHQYDTPLKNIYKKYPEYEEEIKAAFKRCGLDANTFVQLETKVN